MKKCRNGWHFYDGKGFAQVCSKCILGINHPTLRRLNVLRTQRRGLVREGLLPDMRQETKRVPMRSRSLTDYRQAAALLKEDLVWSGDFDNIRYDLMLLITQHANDEIFPENLTKIVQTLIAEENDLSI